jgi:hypothetical protein
MDANQINMILFCHKDHNPLSLGNCISLRKTYNLVKRTFPASGFQGKYAEVVNVCRDFCLDHGIERAQVPTGDQLFLDFEMNEIVLADSTRKSNGKLGIIIRCDKEVSYRNQPLVFRSMNPSKRVSFLDLVVYCAHFVHPRPKKIVCDNSLWWYGENGLWSLGFAQAYAQLYGIQLVNHSFGLEFDLQKKIERAVRISGV